MSESKPIGDAIQIEVLEKTTPARDPKPEQEFYSPANEEERAFDRKINLKLDLIVVSLCALGFMLNAIDKSNVGYAATSTFLEDANLDKDAVGLALTLFSASYIPLHPVSTVMARRIGPKNWISFLLVFCGSVSMGHAGIKSNGHLIGLRVLLGAAEAGYTPCCVYLMSSFYPRYSLGKRLGVFAGMYAVAGAFAGLIAYGILHIDTPKVHGWQALFLIEGGVTIVAGVVIFFAMPTTFENTWFLSESERRHGAHRMRVDCAAAVKRDAEGEPLPDDNKVTMRDVTDVFKDWKKIIICTLTICGLMPINAFGTFLPLIVRGMGYAGIRASLMSVSPFVVGAVGLYLVVFSSDHFRERSVHMICGLLVSLIGIILTAYLHTASVRYGLFHICLAGVFVSAPLNYAWLSGNTPEKGTRAFLLGIMGFNNVGGIIAGQLFKSKYAPSYRYPLKVTMGLIAVNMCGLAFIRGCYMWENRRRSHITADWTEEQIQAEQESEVRRGDQKYIFIYGL